MFLLDVWFPGHGSVTLTRPAATTLASVLLEFCNCYEETSPPPPTQRECMAIKVVREVQKI